MHLRDLRLPAAEIDSFLALQRPNWPAWLAVAIGAGIALYFALPAEPAPWSGVAAVAALILPTIRIRRHPLATIVLAGMCASALGFSAAQLRTYMVRAPQLTREIRFATVTGRVAAIELLPVGERVTLRDPVIAELPPELTPRHLRLKLVKFAAEVAVGDVIRIAADLQPPATPAAPGAFDFRRQAYFMRLGGVGFAFGTPEIIARAPPGPGGSIGRLRQAIGQRIRTALPGPGGAMALALVVGDQTAMSKADAQSMRDSGLAHLLSISGLHIGLAAGLVFFLARGGLAMIPPIALCHPIKKWAAVMALGGAGFYAMLAGITAPTERSLIMTCIVFLAILLDRTPISLRAIAWAAVVILLLQPDLLVGASFQMSFFAVLGLIAAFEALRRPIAAWRRARRDAPDLAGRVIRAAEGVGFWLAGTMATSLVATLMTAPFSIYHFNRLAPYGLIANMIAVPLTGFWIMPAGVAALITMPFGFDAPFWTVMGWGCDVIQRLAETVASWPGAVVLVPAMPTAGLVAVAFGLAWFCLMRGRYRHAAALPVICGFASIALLQSPDVLVADSGKLIAVKNAEGAYWLSSARAERQTAETWLRRNGQAQAETFETASALVGNALLERDLACDALGCIYRAGNTAIGIVLHGDALAEDCAMLTGIVSVEPTRGACRAAKLLIDRFDLFDNGAYAVWLTADGEAIVQDVASSLGQRPWVLRRGPEIEEPEPATDDAAAAAEAQD